MPTKIASPGIFGETYNKKPYREVGGEKSTTQKALCPLDHLSVFYTDSIEEI